MENNSWKIHTLCCYNNVYTHVRLIYGTHCELQTWVFLSWNPIYRGANMNYMLRLYETLWKLTYFKVLSRIHAKLDLSNFVDVTCFKYHVVISQQTKCCLYVIQSMPYNNIGRQHLTECFVVQSYRFVLKLNISVVSWLVRILHESFLYIQGPITWNVYLGKEHSCTAMFY